MQPYVEAVILSLLPEAKEKLLDPPSLQFGTSVEQFKILTAGRSPFAFDRFDSTFRANGSMFGISGEILYGFDSRKSLESATVWNRCVREKYRYPPRVSDVLREYLEWRSVKIPQFDVELDCNVLLRTDSFLEERYGRPISSDLPGDCAGMIARDAICPAMSDGPVRPCKEVAAFPTCMRKAYLAKDRMTRITFEMRTYHLHAVYDNRDYDIDKWREYIVGILGVTAASGAARNPTVDRGFTAFRYLQR
jgi:hypothetical protein